MTDPAGWGSPSTKTVTWYDPVDVAAGMAGRSGLEFMRAIAEGSLPPPPIAGLLGFSIERVDEGVVVFTATPDTSVYNPIGVVHGGFVCTLADSAAGCAVHTTLAAGWAYTSIDIRVDYLRPITAGGAITATGRVVKPGRRVATAAVEVVDGAGKLVATATSACLVMAPSA